MEAPGEVRPAPGPSVAALVAEGDRAHARGDDTTAADHWQRALLVDRALAGRLGVPARLANLASRSGTLGPPPHLDAGSIHSLFAPDGGAP